MSISKKWKRFNRLCGLVFLFPIFLIGCWSGGRFTYPQRPSSPPLAHSTHFSIYALPEGYNAKELLQQSESVLSEIEQWLGEQDLPNEPVAVFVYSPTDPKGRTYIDGHSSTKNLQVRGNFYRKNNMLLLAGNPRNPRFWTVLRHESAHYALHRYRTTTPPPFWMDEGIACLFENGVTADGEPIPTPERLARAQILAQRKHGLKLAPILSSVHPRVRDGDAYAKAWALLFFLYEKYPEKTASLIRSNTRAIPFPLDLFGMESEEMLGQQIQQFLELKRLDKKVEIGTVLE